MRKSCCSNFSNITASAGPLRTNSIWVIRTLCYGPTWIDVPDTIDRVKALYPLRLAHVCCCHVMFPQVCHSWRSECEVAPVFDIFHVPKSATGGVKRQTCRERKSLIWDLVQCGKPPESAELSFGKRWQDWELWFLTTLMLNHILQIESTWFVDGRWQQSIDLYSAPMLQINECVKLEEIQMTIKCHYLDFICHFHFMWFSGSSCMWARDVNCKSKKCIEFAYEVFSLLELGFQETKRTWEMVWW